MLDDEWRESLVKDQLPQRSGARLFRQRDCLLVKFDFLEAKGLAAHHVDLALCHGALQGA